MAEGGFYEQKRLSPTGLALVALLHAAGIAALILAGGPSFIVPERDDPDLIFVPLPTDPPPVPPRPRPESDPRQQRTQLDAVPLRVPTPSRGPVIDAQPIPPQPWTGSAPGGDIVTEPLPQPQPAPQPIPEPVPQPEPVRVEARMDRGVDLQPPYPPSEESAEREGSVTIRLTISPAGRVIGAERVRATSDAFWNATERHARARWRFRPATLDGRPVESRQTLTVHFRLDQ